MKDVKKTKKRVRHYDEYDYEEAYQVQTKNLEEFEVERVLKEGKVRCMYRTCTYQSGNEKSPSELIESIIYPSFGDKQDMPITKKKKAGTSPAQKNLNDKNARRYFIRLVNINFVPGDLFVTLGWDDEHMPKNEEDAKKDVTNYIARINRLRAKMGLEKMKYVYILAFEGYERPHFHILMSGEGMDRDEIENKWGKCSRPNSKRLKPDDDFLLTGIATYITQNPHKKKRWVSNKNLEKPKEPTKSYTKFRKKGVDKMVTDHEFLKTELEKAYPGCTFLDAEIKYNGVNACWYIYARLTKKKEGKKKCKSQEPTRKAGHRKCSSPGPCGSRKGGRS